MLEMADIVLLVTDIRHPVSTGKAPRTGEVLVGRPRADRDPWKTGIFLNLLCVWNCEA